MFDNPDDKKENGFKISERIRDNEYEEREQRNIYSSPEINTSRRYNSLFDTSEIEENNDDSKKVDKFKVFLSAAVGVLTFLVVALIICIIYFWNNGFISTKKESSNSSNSTTQNSSYAEPNIKFEPKPEDENQLSAETVYSQVAPCVVGVVVYDYEASVISDPMSQGSGVIIDEQGYIVTNSHVVNNSKRNNIKIVLNTNEELSGKVIGYDTRTDIAVIKCDKTGLPCATIGDSEQVKVGESVLALGNPLGLDFASTLTRGIVSAVNRSKAGSASSLVKYIQTDAAINPGNSGGPLINMYSQVIGINSLKIGAAGLEGMGFAIPSNVVKDVVSDIISKGYVSGRVRLGIGAKMISNYQAQIYNVPVGIVISKIYNDSNLTASGVQVGDIITKINDVNVTSLDAFYGELYKYKPGDSVNLSIFRTSSTRFGNTTSFDVNIVLLEDRGETQENEDDLYSR